MTGLDLCPYNIERARTRTRTLRIHEGLTFTVASGQRMPYPSNTFDLAWSIESAAYMDDKVAFFREIKRVLKPGGAFAMAAISINPEAVVASPALLETYVAYLRAWDMPFLEPVDRYESIMEESGLAVKRIEDATRWTLDPHAKRLRRLLRCWDWRVLFWLSRWYVGRKSEADLASIRSQLSATHDAIAAGLISYGLYWAVSEEQTD